MRGLPIRECRGRGAANAVPGMPRARGGGGSGGLRTRHGTKAQAKLQARHSRAWSPLFHPLALQVKHSRACTHLSRSKSEPICARHSRACTHLSRSQAAWERHSRACTPLSRWERTDRGTGARTGSDASSAGSQGRGERVAGRGRASQAAVPCAMPRRGGSSLRATYRNLRTNDGGRNRRGDGEPSRATPQCGPEGRRGNGGRDGIGNGSTVRRGVDVRKPSPG